MERQFSLLQSVPPAIMRQAEAERLGDWLCGYRLPQKTWGCLLLLLPLLFFGTLCFGNLQSPVGLIILVITLALLITWAIWTFDTARSRIDLFSNGFLWSSPLSRQTFRWEEIQTLWRGTFRATQPQGVETIDTIKVKHRNGSVFEISTVTQLNEHERARICDIIESYFVSFHLPNLLERYQRGEILNFDPLFVSRSGLSNKGDFLPWSQVEAIESGPERIVIRREGRTSDWYHTWVPRQPNACLLKALLELLQMASRH
ncbi:DUF6585 family protein [Thermogemmatispora sp.]|uniref:DUF6585 family protein n=1 Tax=Thermogemmatispora sp. TaxID=1968838 RepID=UPI0035E3FB55